MKQPAREVTGEAQPAAGQRGPSAPPGGMEKADPVHVPVPNMASAPLTL